ncbi:hypothetical protein [Inhella gelatinilytica]|uniref:LemA protein n=1 Tax=Inhella gelatinilytica TaxID=2795030 RepID=A0A931IW22_9BURK|nr:hypothetical protein [Inhella gelatinilytica]MBH9551683.1 hypothetical protein [Inhella gelatinilytica]
MSLTTALLWAAVAVLVLWGVGAYNRLSRLRGSIASAWAQLEASLNELAQQGLKLAEEGPQWLPQEGAAFEALRTHSQELAAAVLAVKPKPHAAAPVAQLAVVHALHAAALQRVLALLTYEEDAVCQALLDRLKQARQQRSFGQQLFNQRVDAFNTAIDELPTRLLAGLYGLHDAGRF